MGGRWPVLAVHGHHGHFHNKSKKRPRIGRRAGAGRACVDPHAELDGLRPILEAAYHPTQDRPPIDPVTQVIGAIAQHLQTWVPQATP